MAESKDVVTETADGLKTILGRVGDFFHVFDLSFIIAGATSFSAIVFLCQQLGIQSHCQFSPWITGIALVIACYVCGLLCFSLGRLLNGYLFRRSVLGKRLEKAIETHQLVRPPLTRCEAEGCVNNKRAKSLYDSRLYTRLWQQLAARHSRSAAYYHLSRNWAMAATYDGVAIALFAWAVVIVIAEFVLPPPNTPLTNNQAIAAAAVLLGATVLSLKQGGKCYEIQVEDLVAALAVVQKSEEGVPILAGREDATADGT